ncbi:hypothetical protein, partial [Mycobacterium alsense]|uniref:hypothetical protein n=1 Tax=Mycobacterium alsense TaxID=324058 RepID=UPI001B80520B
LRTMPRPPPQPAQTHRTAQSTAVVLAERRTEAGSCPASANRRGSTDLVDRSRCAENGALVVHGSMLRGGIPPLSAAFRSRWRHRHIVIFKHYYFRFQAILFTFLSNYCPLSGMFTSKGFRFVSAARRLASPNTADFQNRTISL